MVYARKFLICFASLGFVLGVCVVSVSAVPTSRDLLKRKGFVWTSASTEHLRLYFEPGTFAERQIEYLKTRQEKAYARNLKLLDAGSYPHQTDIFIVDSRERMKALIGDETNGVAYPTTKVACFVYSEKADASGSHELMHVMAGNAWGTKFKPWINEGLAGYADDIWHGHKLHDLSKYFLKEQKLISLEDLVENFRAQPHMLSYPQAASFVKYLYETYGVAKVRELWERKCSTTPVVYHHFILAAFAYLYQGRKLRSKGLVPADSDEDGREGTDGLVFITKPNRQCFLKSFHPPDLRKRIGVSAFVLPDSLKERLKRFQLLIHFLEVGVIVGDGPHRTLQDVQVYRLLEPCNEKLGFIRLGEDRFCQLLGYPGERRENQ